MLLPVTIRSTTKKCIRINKMESKNVKLTGDIVKNRVVSETLDNVVKLTG